MIDVDLLSTLYQKNYNYIMTENIKQRDSSSDKSYIVLLFTVQQRFHIMNVPLDKSTFWKLFACWDIKQKEVLTVKTINDSQKQSHRLQHKKQLISFGVRNEVAILENLSHQNIPKLRGYCETERSSCIFMDYFPRGSLQSIVSKQGALQFQDLVPLLRQLIRVVCYLHSKGIIHRDISPRNVYINDKGKLQLLNFISSYNIEEYSLLKEELPEKNVFMAPEIFAGQRVTPKTDVWGMGVTLFYMLYGCSPWPHIKETDWHRRIGSTIVYPEGCEMSAKLRQCIEKMLVYEPEIRIGANELAKLFGA